MFEGIKDLIRLPLWILSIACNALYFKYFSDIYEGLYSVKPVKDQFFLTHFSPVIAKNIEWVIASVALIMTLVGWATVRVLWAWMWPEPSKVQRIPPAQVELWQPPCMQQSRYDAAVNLGAQGLRNFIKECKEDGGDLLHKAYDDLDSLLYKTSITCLKELPLCQERNEGQCYDEYHNNGINPNIGSGSSPGYVNLKKIGAQLTKHMADCMTYSFSYPKPTSRPKISIDSNYDKADANMDFAGFTIQFELTEALKECKGNKCSQAGQVSTRHIVYVDYNGRDVIFFGRVDLKISENDNDNDGDKERIGQPYIYGQAGQRWQFERVFQSDAVTGVFIIKE